MPARLARAAAWVLFVLAASVTASRWLDVAYSPVVLVQSLSPVAAALAAIALVGALVPAGRVARSLLATGCVLVLAVHAAVWAPWLTGEEPGAGRPLTVMATNLLQGRADAGQVSELVRAHGVDVLVLTEVRGDAEAKLRAAGVHRLLPHAVPRTPSGAGTVIRSRTPLAPAGAADGLATTSTRNPAATLVRRGALTVRGVHPPPPVSSSVGQWRSNLATLAAWAHSTGGPLVMVGDFNASVDHPALREVLAADLRDAHEVTGAGRPRTWPHGRRVPAFVHIDHVLVRGVEVAASWEAPIRGTDHLAVFARLVVPAPQGPR